MALLSGNKMVLFKPSNFFRRLHLQKQPRKRPKTLAATKLAHDRNCVSGNCFDILVPVQDKQNTVSSGQRKDSSTNVCFFLKKNPAEGT